MLGLKLNHVNKRGHRSKQGELWTKWVKTLRKKQYGCTLQRIFSNSLLWVEIAFFIHVSLKLVLKGPVDIKPSLVQIMAPTGWQAIVGINNGPVIWRIDAFHGFNELNWVGILTAPLFRDACKCLRWLDHFKIQSPVFFFNFGKFLDMKSYLPTSDDPMPITSSWHHNVVSDARLILSRVRSSEAAALKLIIGF